MASHPLRRQIRYRYFGLDPHPRAPRPLPTSRHGPRPLQADLQNLASLRPDTWRSHIEVVAMAGFTGIKSAAAEELPGARAVMDPFHVVHLAGDALDECRRRILQELHHRRGRAQTPIQEPQDVTPQILPAHAAPAVPTTQPVFQRRARRPRGHLERLSEHH